MIDWIDLGEFIAICGLVWKLAKVHSQIERQEERIEGLESAAQDTENRIQDLERMR